MSDHSRTHPDQLDRTAQRMHGTAAEVDSAAAEFDGRISGAGYGGGSTAELVRAVVTGVGRAVGGGPDGAGGRIARHQRDYADGLRRHAATARRNEAEIIADIEQRARALAAARPATAPSSGLSGGGGSRITRALDTPLSSAASPGLPTPR